MLDGDEAGRFAPGVIAHALTTRMPVTAVSLEEGTNPIS